MTTTLSLPQPATTDWIFMSPKIHMLKFQSPVWLSWDEVLGEMIKSGGRTLVNRIKALRKETPEMYPPPSAIWGHRGKLAVWARWHPDSRLQIQWLWEINICRYYAPMHGALYSGPNWLRNSLSFESLPLWDTKASLALYLYLAEATFWVMFRSTKRSNKLLEPVPTQSCKIDADSQLSRSVLTNVSWSTSYSFYPQPPALRR